MAIACSGTPELRKSDGFQAGGNMARAIGTATSPRIDAQPCRQTTSARKETGRKASGKERKIEELALYPDLPGADLWQELDILGQIESVDDEPGRSMWHPWAKIAGDP